VGSRIPTLLRQSLGGRRCGPSLRLRPPRNLSIRVSRTQRSVVRTRSGVRLRAVVVLQALAVATLALSCNGAGGAIVAVALGQALERIDRMIDEAANRADGRIMRAGGELRLTVESARVVYREELDRTLEEVNASVSRHIEEIEGLTDDLVASTAETADKITLDAQALTNTLPFANREPQLTRYTPAFATNAGPLRLAIRGNFLFAQRAGFEPTLEANNAVLRPTSNTTQRLTFEVPANRLPASSPNEVAPATLILHVPYETGTIRKKRYTAHFTILVGIVPPSPGSIQFFRRWKRTEVDQQPGRSPTYSIDSKAAGSDVNEEFCAPPQRATAGYLIDPLTVEKVIEQTRGNEGQAWALMMRSPVPGSVCAIAKTWAYCWCDPSKWHLDGLVTFHFSWTEVKAVDVDIEDPPEPIQLGWGESRSRDVPSGRWRLVYTSFAGKIHEVETAAFHDEFVKVRINGSAVTVSATELEKIFAG
jgi:hypothetical protein